jgi:nucleoid-associated protein YgaU
MATATPHIKVGWVQLSSTDPPLSVLARLSEDQPVVTQGYGGWEEVARPRSKPLTTWIGSPGWHMNLGLMLDRWARSESVEDQIATLETMGRPTASDGNPPRLTISAPGSAVQGESRTWVIDTITWGEALMGPAGNRQRQVAVLSLIEYQADVHLKPPPAKKRQTRATQAKKGKGQGATKKRVSAKRSHHSKTSSAHSLSVGLRATIPASPDFGQGEDLASIAARELGDASRWVEIAELNGLRDPQAITPGQVLRLP